MFEKLNQQIHFRLWLQVLFYLGACFCMGAYKHNAVVLISL